ncbi:alcohol dehydrogenase catalytic domain-containing protein [Streptomyces sp. SID8352]|nr:alcohol dehydrogenase catalytic domain-containing protein [Streptomyces sp. SID8352]MYU22394.1 alcohol dehydrogenase catalytic domain-containing protein [Streptomyces sp. SID8352]
MQAYRIPEWEHPAEVVEVPVPVPGPGQVLVKVAGCGLCHSDFTMLAMPAETGRAIGWSMPFTLGHETAGHIAELGPGVTGFAPGDAVALVSPASCGTCSFCVRGQDNNCPNAPAGRGFGRDGGLAEYVLVDDPRGLLPLGGLDPRTAGPLTDAGATSYHAVRRALPRVRPGGTAVVIGTGGLGAFAVQYLRLLTGADVVAVDTDAARLEVARELGAHHTLVGTDEETAGRIRALTDGYGADAVLDFVGVDATIATGTAAVRPGGAYGLVGAAMGRLQAPWYGGLPRDGEVFTFQGSGIADVREVLTLAGSGRIRNNVDLFPFSRIEEAYGALRDGTLRGRAVVTFDD